MSDFFNTLKTQYHINLNDQQMAAVRHQKGPALVLAGPGSGKTTVITARTAFLISEAGISPDQILTVTFNKAAQLEMKHRFHHLFGENISHRNMFSTFHSLCYSVVKDYEKRQGKRLKLIEGESGNAAYSKQYILKQIYKEINGAPINEDELETLINEIGFVKNRMIKDFEGLSLQTLSFQDIFKAYDDYKKQNLLMDFDDMLTYSFSILNHCPDILMKYKSRFTYFQVDEGQDLSEIQFKILKLLVASDENNLFLVADDDQSIYGFRGAEPHHILGLKDHFSGLKLFKLENNYRSSHNIVDISSKFIRSNRKRYDKSHRTCNPESNPPQIIRVGDVKEQLDFIVKKIKQHCAGNEFAKIAVLYRSNLSSIALVDRFDRECIACRLKQNRVHFFQHWLIQDVLAFLRFSLDPCDQEAFLRIYAKMNRYITKAMMENASNFGSDLPVIERILKSNELKPFQAIKLNELIREFRKLSKMSPYKALQSIENDFKFFASVKSYCDRTGLSFDYLYGLFGILSHLSLSAKSLLDFLSRVDDLCLRFENNHSSEDTHPFITLSTLHSSKGLEYDAVFMIDLINREIPGERAFAKSKKDKDEELMEEERRLFFVGMTRARTWLYLVSPESVNGESTPRSTFVNEVAALLNHDLNDQIGEGVPIIHRKYGKGVIASVKDESSGTMVEIDFKGLTRVFDLSVCLEKGIIEIER